VHPTVVTDSDTAAPAPVVDASVPRVVVWIALGLVAVPFVVAALSVFGMHWNPVGDQAIMVMRIHDVGTAHTPLLGQWSRWGWAHPGPLTFWLLAPFWRMSGNDAVLVGTALLNLAAAVGVVIAAARISPTAAVLAGTITAVLAHGVGLDFLVYLWNPWTAFFPFVLFLVLVWVVLSGRTGWLALAVGAGSFVLQSHAGYVALVGGMLAFALVGPARAALRRVERADRDAAASRRRARRQLGAAFLVGFVLWLPPLVQQATGHPGNVTALARYTSRDEPTAGWDAAFGTMGTQLRPTGPWLSDDEQTDLGFERLEGVWVAVVTLVVTAGLGGLAARRGHRSAAALAAVALSAVVLALVSTARVTGPLLTYVIAFWRPIAAITYLSVVWSALVLVARRTAWRAATAVALAVLAGLSVRAIATAPATPPIPTLSRAIGAVGPPTVAALRPDRRYLVEGQDNATLNGGVAGLAWYLETHGRHALLAHEKLAALRFGSFRLADRDAVDGRVLLVAQSAVDTGWTRPERARLIARFDPLSRTERARARRLQARVRQATRTPSEALLPLGARVQRDIAVRAGARRGDVEELGRLQRRGEAYRVYVAPV
jgi:hypothetical protein